MTMTRRGAFQDQYCMLTMEDMVPKNHLVRKLNSAFDFSFIYDEVKSKYSRYGRASIDPVVLFKLVMINKLFNINSMRKTIEECEVNVAYRLFLGYHMEEKLPCFSVWSKNYQRKFKGTDIFKKIFCKILEKCDEEGFLKLDTVFEDGTHQKANANKRKSKKEVVELVAKEYEEDLLKEINEDREMTGLKPAESPIIDEIVYDENTGEEKVVIKTKEITVSTTDPECGVFNKGEHERQMAYEHQTICDKNGFVLETKVVPGNIHDSVSFFKTYKEIKERFGDRIKGFCLDAGYKTPAICRQLINDGFEVYMPYTRPKGLKGYMPKKEYVYDETYDCYICPNGEILSYTITDKQGYRKYESEPEKCKDCPFLETCTQSKNHKKVILRHVWENFVEQVEEVRGTDKWKEIYPQRKETIERVFADCKEYHGLRYTRERGLEKNQDNSYIIFGVHNLKRLALWSSKKD